MQPLGQRSRATLPRRVVLFYKRLLGPGGAERQFVEEYKFLRDRSVTVKVLAFEVREEALFGNRVPELEVIHAEDQLGAVVRLRRSLSRFAPDVVSVHSGHMEVYAATRGLGIPYVYHHNNLISMPYYHPTDYLQASLYRTGIARIVERTTRAESHLHGNQRYGLPKRAYIEAVALLNRAAIRGAKEIIVLSQQTAWEIEQIYQRGSIVVRGCLDPRILQYTPRLDVKRELGLDGKIMLLSISRLTLEKRVDLLIEAFARLRQEMGDITLVIGGKGDDEEKLKDLADGLGCGRDVRFLGFIPEGDLWDHYAACDLFVTPAWADFNIAPYEALALGRKVVWSTEMEAEQWLLASGLVFPAEPSLTALSEVMRRALKTDVDGRPDWTGYTWSRKFERVYESIWDSVGGGAG